MNTQPVNYMRQTDLFDPSKFDEAKVTIVGVGNIGSHAALTIGRLGIKNFTLYDDDIVEMHNISSQHYDAADDSSPKVEALARQLKAQNPAVNYTAYAKKYEEADAEPADIFVSAVDSIEARRILCDALTVLAPDSRPKHIIDARVGGDQVELYVCDSPAAWRETFVDNPGEDPCGGRFIAYTSVVAGALIANTVKKLLKGEPTDASMMLHVGSMQVVKNFTFANAQG